ncbi:hypothetical protein [Nocardia asteroides]|uniref:hypothetical protein n=1 Tax=Nocardia asteroides TaxID=1824 RepID=UPI001E2AFE2E|nr:hypothetical protein [Nocardia asteroides]UGT62566.1 hypothetical protein LTT61_04250 [Nocardia asteroides]
MTVNVDPVALQQTAQGITGMIGVLTDLGIKETAASGRGFALLTLSPLEAGHPRVQGSFETYCERWSWGVRSMVQSGNEIAEALNIAAGRYHMMDSQASEVLATLWTHTMGNPHLSRDEIAQRSWSETLADNPINNIVHPDYSRESFAQAELTIEQNWQVVEEVGPQALANVSVLTNPLLADDIAQATGETPGWDTDGAERAAQLLAPPE